MLSEQEQDEIRAEVAKYPQSRAAAPEALKIVQRAHGWVDDANLTRVAALLGMTTAELDSVATFYNLIYRRPVGRHVIHLCDSVSCWIMGYETILSALEKRLGINELGQTSADGRFTLLPVPCLGCCDRAPAMLVDGDLHTDLTEQKLDEVLAKYA